MAKQIILLLDGSWNDADIGPSDTNIVRLGRRIAGGLEKIQAKRVKDEGGQAEKSVAAGSRLSGSYRTRLGQAVHVFYERGVGTGAHDLIRGGAFGYGLSQNIRSAYLFLSFHYEPGDQVFIFGFSRGAFTARSLVGLIAASGLLKPQNCTTELENRAWEFYRTPVRYRRPANWYDLQNFTYPHDAVEIACLGVFDTVGALGVPFHAYWRLNRERYEFHDVELSSIVRLSLHAVAIDEHRWPFQATMWQKPAYKRINAPVEQVWFPGAHADIGGGYIPEDLRVSRYQDGLDEVTLDWMAKRVGQEFPDFPYRPGPFSLRAGAWSLGEQHESRRSFYRAWPKAYRSIANVDVPRLRGRETTVGHDRRTASFCQMVHISALERLGEKITIDGSQQVYRPANLYAVLDMISRTYDSSGKSSGEVKVVDWSGKSIEPDKDGCSRIGRLIARGRFLCSRA